MGEMRVAYNIWLEYLEGRDYLEELGVCRKVILEWVLWK
jgi:hypothetical protein